MTFLLCIRAYGRSCADSGFAAGGERVVNMGQLNNASLLKDLVLGYLGAAMLDPLLSITDNRTTNKQVAVNLAILFGIFWWIYVISDAFDSSDTTYGFKYAALRDSDDVTADPEKYKWLHVASAKKAAHDDRAALTGSFARDLALWFVLACIGAAFAGSVTHRDAMHAWSIAILWVILHHRCRRATVWSAPYFVTLFLPSQALLPMEYCLPLQNMDDLKMVQSWRAFIKRRCGIDITIQA